MAITPSPPQQPLAEVFGANVRRTRIRKGMSVPELAHATGYTPEFIDAIESGAARESGLAEVEVFAAALSVEAEELVSRV